ncbi:MAG: tetratricopeptide repeat protein, partial [Desulfobacteraceae bacterium]
MIWRYNQMKTTKLLLIGIAFVLVGCGGSSYVAQDIFLVNQGFDELSNSNYLEAEAYLRAALDINPNNPYTLLNLGVVYQDTGRTKEAVQMYQKVLELNPEETAVESNREGYSGKKIVEIARENLKSLGILIAEKGPAMSTMGLGESVVTDSEVNTVVIQYEAQLQIASYSAAGHASALDTEGNQDTVDITSGGPSGIGASAEGPGGEAASGAGSTGGGS